MSTIAGRFVAGLGGLVIASAAEPPWVSRRVGGYATSGMEDTVLACRCRCSNSIGGR